MLAFLDYLETERKNCAATRNCRLVAIHRFFAYVADRDPTHAELCRRVLDIPIKRTSSRSMTYLDQPEIAALLRAPSRSQRLGLRDRALLTLMYNTGARASEVVALDIVDLRLEPPAQVRIVGKGRKERVCPLWAEAAGALRAYLGQRPDGSLRDAPVFLNAHGGRITRYGVGTILQRNVTIAAESVTSLSSKCVSPHTLRHTAAMHLLQAGVELNVIRSWLGHVSITTTSQYIEIDMEMKRRAIERCPSLGPHGGSLKPAGTPTRTSSNGSTISEPKTYVELSRDPARFPTCSRPQAWVASSPAPHNLRLNITREMWSSTFPALGATYALWANAGSSVWPSRRRAFATFCGATAFGQHRRASGPSWSEFLRAPAASTVACDFFHVGTVMLRRLYVLFFIDLERRTVFLAGVAAHPVGTWVTQQARNLAATLEDQGRAIRFLVHDRDAKLVGPFDEVMRSIGARVASRPSGRLRRTRSRNALCGRPGPSASTGC